MEEPKTLISPPTLISDAETAILLGDSMPAKPPCIFSFPSSTFVDARKISTSKKRLMAASALSTVFFFVEVYGGFFANSLCVLTDAVRLFSNTAVCAISLVSLHAAGWSSTAQASFGYYRLEILGALLSVQITWLSAGVLLYKALERIVNYGGEVQGLVMLSVSAFRLVVNALVAALVSRVNGEDRVRTIGDSIQTVGVMTAGGFIWWKPEWKMIDPALAVLLSTISVARAVKMARKILSVLMEGCPREIDVKRLEKGLLEIDGVVSVHDVHVWAITLGKVVLTCHLTVALEADADDVLRKVVEYIRKEYGVLHVTVQIERR